MKLTKEQIEFAKRNFGFTDNDIFRHVLASDDDQSREILKIFISQIVHKEIVDVEIGNTEPIKDVYYEKGMRLDVFVKCRDEYGNDKVIDLEIQNYGASDYIASRAMSYKAKLISSQIKMGDDSFYFDEVYQVMILNKVKFENDTRYYHEYCLMDIESKKLFPNNKEHIVVIELEKMNVLDVDHIKEWSPLEKMSYLMKYAHDESKHDIIKILEEEHEVLKMMLDKKDDFFKTMAEDVGKFKEMIHRHDMEHKDEILIEQGVEKGRAEEREESKKTFVINMHTDGIPLEQIARISKVSVEEVKNILGVE